MPGSVLMTLCANAAYATVSDDFSLDSLQAHFLSGPKDEPAYDIHVQRLNDGGRFATRGVILKQSGQNMVFVTCSFVRAATLTGQSMQHCVTRASSQRLDQITLDDLEPERTYLGPWMKFQRLAVEYTGPECRPVNPLPETLTYSSVAQIIPTIPNDSRRTHALGVVSLSDYHVLDGPPNVHCIPHGQPRIGDHSRTPQPSAFSRITSMSHSINFHVHDGFRADELCYIEVTSPWTASRRGEIQSRIFDKAGRLIATCKQEAYYVLNDEAKL